MARFLNTHTAPLVVGGKIIDPGQEIDLTADEAKFSGVQSFLADGMLTEAKAKAEAAKPKE